jgi:DNA-binding NarL/FixJ family response regulator
MGGFSMRVVIVDPHPLFREGLKRALDTTHDLRVVGEVAHTRDLPLQQSDQCDLITLDGELESLLFLQERKKVRSKDRPPFVLVISRCTEPQHVFQILSAGADGYVSKSEPNTTVIAGIRKVAGGKKFLTQELSDALLVNIDETNRRIRLSQREYEVLYLFGSGLGSSEIAERLSLSVKTISTYRSRLLDKLKARNNAELIRYAVREGIVI